MQFYLLYHTEYLTILINLVSAKRKSIQNPEIMICLADNRLINTIVRASPGLMIMKKGLIVAKWSRWSFPFD